MSEKEVLYYRKLLESVLVTPGTFADCYAFSIHKAGSTLMHSMIAGVCKRAKIPGVSIPDALFKLGIFEKDWAGDRALLELFEPGRIYFGFRHLPEILLGDTVNLREKKSVLLVRDPRDALVSQFFSYGGKYISHKLPEKGSEVFLQKVKATEDLTIDEYVLRASQNYLGKLVAYRENLNFDNVLLCKYEDIYFDKRTFLKEIFQHFGFEVDSRVVDDVASKHDIRPEVEDPTMHIRKGAPGDHVDKLQPRTIAKLNGLFAATCNWFGYDLRLESQSPLARQ